MAGQGLSGKKERRSSKNDVDCAVDSHGDDIPGHHANVPCRTRTDTANLLKYNRWKYEELPVSAATPHDIVREWLDKTVSQDIVPLSFNFDAIIDKANLNHQSSRQQAFEWFIQFGKGSSKQKREPTELGRLKRLRVSSPESSFLEPATGLAPDDERHERFEAMAPNEIQGPKKTRKKRRKRQRSSSSDGDHTLSPVHVAKDEIFERRKRHKMREDLRESLEKPVSQGFQGKVDRHRRRKADKSSTRPKGINGRGGNLMNNFSSKSVGHDRLTIRPSKCLGVFKNGRASSPGRKRGLPDLAFSEMEFLQRSKQRAATAKEPKQPSKYREKEKRTNQRMHNEISEYFKTSMSPLAEGKVWTQDYEQSHDHALRRSQTVAREKFLGSCYQTSYPPSYSHSNRPSARSVFGAEHEGRAVEEIQEPSKHLWEAPRIETGFRERVVTDNLTTGNSQRSIVSARSKLATSRSSITPDLIRKSLDQTGIYDYTGIDRKFARAHAHGSWPVVESAELKRLSTVSPLGDASKIRLAGSADSQESIKLQDAIAKFRCLTKDAEGKMTTGSDACRMDSTKDKEKDSQTFDCHTDNRRAQEELKLGFSQGKARLPLGTPQITSSIPMGTNTDEHLENSEDCATMIEGADRRPMLSTETAIHVMFPKALEIFEPERNFNVVRRDVLAARITSASNQLDEIQAGGKSIQNDLRVSASVAAANLKSELPIRDGFSANANLSQTHAISSSAASIYYPLRVPSRNRTSTTISWPSAPPVVAVSESLCNYQLEQQKYKEFLSNKFDLGRLEDTFEEYDGYVEKSLMGKNDFSDIACKNSAEETEQFESPDLDSYAISGPGFADHEDGLQFRQDDNNRVPQAAREDYISNINVHSHDYGNASAPVWLVPRQNQESVRNEMDLTGFWRPYRRY